MEQYEPSLNSKSKKINHHTIINLNESSFESKRRDAVGNSPDVLEIIQENVHINKNKGKKKKDRNAAPTPPGSPSTSQNWSSERLKRTSTPESTIINIKESQSSEKTRIVKHKVVLSPNDNQSQDNLSQPIFSQISSVDLSSPLSFLNTDDDLMDISKMASIDSGLDESISEDEKLRLLNNRLEGTLTTLGNEAKSWLRERAQFAAEVSSLKSHLACSRITCEDAIKKVESLTNELISSKKRYEIQIHQLNQTINQKTSSINHLTESLNKTKDDHTNLSLKLQKYDANSTEKNQVSLLLKKKITDLCMEINQLKTLQQKSTAIEMDLRSQVDSLRKSKIWFSEQLNIFKASQERLSTELLQMKEFLREGSLHNHKLSHENTCLQSQLICMKTALIDAKRSMSKQLDAIRNEMVEREALFATIEKDKGSFEELLRQKIITLNETQLKMDELNGRIIEYQNEITKISDYQFKTEICLKESQEEKKNLEDKIEKQETSLTNYSEIIEEYKRKMLEIQRKYDDLTSKLGSNEVMLQGLEEEKIKLSQIINSLENERIKSFEYTEKLKVEINSMNERLAFSEAEINSRNETINNYYAQIIQLENDSKKLNEDLTQKKELVTILQKEKDELSLIVQTTSQENVDLKEKLQKSKLELEVIRISLVEEHERKVNEIQMNHESERNKMRDQLIYYENEIDALKGTIEGLEETNKINEKFMLEYESLRGKYEALYAKNTKTLEDFNRERENSTQALQNLERDYSERFKDQKNQISNQITKISSLEGEIVRINCEITALQQAKEHALEENCFKYQKIVDSLNAELEKVKQDYSNLHNDFESTKIQYSDNETRYKEQISEHLKVLSKLEARLGVIPNLEAKQKKLMKDLEMYLGKEQGLRQSYMTLKNHAESLELALAQKEEIIAKMTHEADLNKRELAFASYSTQSALVPSETIVECKAVNQQMNSSNVVNVDYQMSSTPYQSSIVPGSPPDLYLLEEELKRVHCEKDKLNETFEQVNAKFAETLAKLTCIENSYETQKVNIEELQNSNYENNQSKYELQTKYDDVLIQNQSLTEKNKELKSLLDKEFQRSSNLELDMKQICVHHSQEIESMRKIIESATNHLKSVNKELNDTRIEKTKINTFLSQIRGTLRGCLEKHRTLMKADARMSSESVTMNVTEIETMIGEALSSQNYLFNKPLLTIDNLIVSMNGEINQLETKLEDHTVIVHDSIHHWKLVEKFIAENLTKLTLKEQPSKTPVKEQ